MVTTGRSAALRAMTCFIVLPLASLMFISTVVGGCSYYGDEPRSADELRRDIEGYIQPGDSLEDILVYLEREGARNEIQYSMQPARASDYSHLVELGLPPDTPVLGAIVFGTTRDLNIVFVLNSDLRFVRLITWESPISP